MPSAAIYVRVSTEAQAEKGYSLETQLQAARQAANDLGATTIDEYVDDGYSGEYINRPDITRLRENLKTRNYAYVIVYDPDRLARNLAHQLILTEEIEKSGAKLKFVSVEFENSPEGKLFYSIRGAISAFEKEKIKERTNRGKKRKAELGKVISNTHPFGYDWDAENSTYIINGEEADIIRQIFNWCVTDRIGTPTICIELNSRGINTPRNKNAWTPSSVYRILQNTMYKGIIYSRKFQYIKTGLKSKKKIMRPEEEWVPIYVPSIVDEQIWQLAQSQLGKNKSLSKRNTQYIHLLQDVVYCSVCGKRMKIMSGGKGSTKYYGCISNTSVHYLYGGNGKACGARKIPADLLDSYILKCLKDIMDSPHTIQKYRYQQQTQPLDRNKQIILEQLNATEKKCIEQRSMITKWFRSNMIDAKDAEDQLKDIQKQLIEIVKAKTQLQNEIAAIKQPLSEEVIFDHICRRFSEIDFSEKERVRAGLLDVIDKVYAKRIDNTIGRGSRPDIIMSVEFR